jgi:three-Cys-motif partner protein
MAKKNDDFFVEKKPWSKVKDELLGCYFKPYVQKILYTYKPLVYIDCFAGKGKFDDGNPGSPLIALDIMKQCLASTKMNGTPKIGAAFIDLNYALDLEENLKDYHGVKIVPGKYEEQIDGLLKGKDGCNVFLYIDPYGIKALDCSKFDSFASGQFNSIELLINMNSFGFIREGCRVLGAQFKTDDSDLFDELVEYEPTVFDTSESAIQASIQALNDIAGGDYWKAIIEQYKKKEINGYEAEEYFAEKYCQRLSQSYTYVLNMPIRIQKGQHSKYRMIHATNHPDGCLLMVDNICNRWELLQQLQTGGQLSLWTEDINNQSVDEAEIESKVVDHFSQCDNWTSLSIALAIFFVKHGVICNTGTVTKILKKFEKDGRITIMRNPIITQTGKPSAFMQEGKGKTVSVKWVN